MHAAPEPPERIDALDALRGVAALLVVACHCLLAWPVFAGAYFGPAGPADGLAWWLTYTPLHLLWGGQEEVVLFFVLSGFALALPYVAGTAAGYGAYLAKRLFRLYPPYLAAVAVAALLVLALDPAPVPGLSGWFHRHWLQPLGWDVAVDHLLVRGTPRHNFLDAPVWSLVHEMRISLAFPLLMALVLRLPAVGVAALALGCYAAGGWLMREPGLVALTWAQTVQYAACFVIGAGLARWRREATAFVAGLGRGPLVAFVVVALFLFNVRWQLPAFGRGTDLLTAIGAAGMIMLAVGRPRLRAALEAPGLRWLGRISYSLYLVHMIVLLGLVHALGRHLPLGLVIALVLPASLVAAQIMHRVVEAPSRAWGRRLAEHRLPALGRGQAQRARGGE